MRNLTENNNKGPRRPSLYFRFLRFIEKITKKKFLIKFSIVTISLLVIFFPALIGETIGIWYYKFTQAFIESTK